MAGTDTFGFPSMAPGIALQKEFELLHEGGLAAVRGIEVCDSAEVTAQMFPARQAQKEECAGCHHSGASGASRPVEAIGAKPFENTWWPKTYLDFCAQGVPHWSPNGVQAHGAET